MEYKTNLKIKSFTDLQAWKEAHQLAILVYKLTEEFPRKETYSLTDQIRRSVVSVSSNIAEGFSRQTKKEKEQLYSVAKGSLTELQNQLLLARDVGYLPKEGFNMAAERTVKVSKLITGLSRAAKSR